MTEMDAALYRASQIILENQKKQRNAVHEILDALWLTNRSLEDGLSALPVFAAVQRQPAPVAQPLDDVLDEFIGKRIEAPETDPEIVSRIRQISLQLERGSSALPPPLPHQAGRENDHD